MFARNKLVVLLAGAVVLSIRSVRAQDTKTPRVSTEQVHAAARALAADVAHLAEDLQIEMRRLPNAEHLLDDAREAAESAEHLAASLDQGADLSHAAKDFQEFDKAWHHVAEQLRTAAVSRSLQRGARRVAQTDSALHRMLGGPVPVDAQEVRRLADSLAQSAQHLLEDAHESLGQSVRYGQLLQLADDFAEAAEHFRGSLAQGVNIEHARKDFAAVDEAWQELSDRLYTPSPYRFEHLHESASRVVPTVGQLASALGVVADAAPPTAFRSDPARSRRTFAPDFDDSAFLPPPYDSTTGRYCAPRGLPRRLILPNDDECFDGPFSDGFVPPRSSGSSSLGELRSLEQPSPSRRIELSPQRPARPLQPQGEPQPRGGTSDEEMHEHSDGHKHLHGPAPSPAPSPVPTPTKPTTPATPSAKKPAPRPAEPELSEEARANLSKLPAADRNAAIAQHTCPVTGDVLGEMGVPIKVRVQGRDVFVCCKGCVAKVGSGGAGGKVTA